jgi:hypothetical protein
MFVDKVVAVSGKCSSSVMGCYERSVGYAITVFQF